MLMMLLLLLSSAVSDFRTFTRTRGVHVIMLYYGRRTIIIIIFSAHRRILYNNVGTSAVAAAVSVKSTYIGTL